MTTRLAVFDCDGTLVDSQANICLAMEDAFARAHLEAPSRHAIRRVVGLSLVEAMRALLPEADAALHAHLAEDYKTAFGRLRGNGLVHEPLFPGIVDLLVELTRRGWLLGVATGKSDRGLKTCLDTHDIVQHFTSLQTADRHPSKPHPAMLQAAMAETGAEPWHSAMIGDTGFDISMAKAAGVMAIGVAWGYHEPEELMEAGADAVAADAPDLLRILETRR